MNALGRAVTQLRRYPFLESLCMPLIVFLLSACQIGGTYAPWGLAAVAGCGVRRGFPCARRDNLRCKP